MGKRLLQFGLAVSFFAAGCGSRSGLEDYPSEKLPVVAGLVPIVCHSSVAASSTVNVKSPLQMEIILDGSGSMSDDHKWVAAVTGLDVIFDDFLAEEDPTFAAGLIVFSDRRDPTVGEGPYPTATDVPPALVDKRQRDAMRARLDRTTPGGGTPTFRALEGGFGVLRAFDPPSDRNPQKILVILTDGVPSGPLGVPNSHEIEQAQCLDLVTAERGGLPSIRTFAVGIGPFPGNTDYDPNFMGDLAIAGGTRSSPVCDPHATNEDRVCHFQISPLGKPTSDLTREFVSAIDRIRQVAVRSCEFTFVDNDPVDPTNVIVDWTDGAGKKESIAEDTDNGWTYDARRRTVVLHGRVCAEVSADFSGDVSVRRSC